MLDKARGRGVYTDLECAELTDYLATRHVEFDLAIAADVFVWYVALLRVAVDR